MTLSIDEAPHRLKLTRAANDSVYVWSNDRCLYFSKDMWDEFLRMGLALNGDTRVIQNFTEPPERLVAPPAPRVSLDDLA